MAKIIITGKDAYIRNLSKHLRKEHPSTKKRMKVVSPKRVKNKKIIFD